ncbi:MAG: hypothetical protein E7393_05790 [Ruminococcaceae bacterium]|nr:hypothetical protein [Oscillospiraceae bacterium]
MTVVEEKLLLARLADLERQAERGNKPCFSRFLDPGEIRIFTEKMRPFLPTLLWGGYEDAERKMVGFFPDFMNPDIAGFPLCALRFSAAEPLGHRTVLGSVMGLGLERNLIGDVATEATGPLLFTCEAAREYLCMNLTRAGKIPVKVTEAPIATISVLPREWLPISGTVASLRLDCVLGLLMGVSRAGAEDLLKHEMVSVNFSVCTKGSSLLSAGDVLSVRKFGRAELLEICGETKKGRIRIILKKYI